MTQSAGEKFADIRFEERDGYLHALVTGEEDSLSISREYWQRVIDECNSRNSSKLLVEEDFPDHSSTRIGTFEMFDLVVEISKMLVNPLKIAFVDRNLERDELNRFAETVAINRGVHGRIFNDPASAAQWLLS